jgi:hypothetical protein
MHHQARPEHRKTFPLQFLAQRAAQRAVDAAGRRQHQRPAAVPVQAGRRIDAAVGALESRQRCRFERVTAAPPLAAGGQPAFLHQPEYAGAHQALGDAERRHQFDQAAEPNARAVGRHRVAQDGHYHRLGARRIGGEELGDPLTAIELFHRFRADCEVAT